MVSLTKSLSDQGKYHCTVDLLFDWFGISCMTTDNFCFYLQNRLIQTSQTGGQRYSDTSPFSIPWSDHWHPTEQKSFEQKSQSLDLPSWMISPSSSVDELHFRIRAPHAGGGDRTLNADTFFDRFLAGKFKLAAGSDCRRAISLRGVYACGFGVPRSH